jgi:hypothetical protein
LFSGSLFFSLYEESLVVYSVVCTRLFVLMCNLER